MTSPRGARPLPHAQPLDLPLRLLFTHLANGISPASLASAQADWLVHLLASPSKQAELALEAWRQGLRWWHAGGQSGGWPGLSAPPPSGIEDKRFAHPDWQLAPFSHWARAFLLAQQWWADATHGVRGVSPHHEEVVAFMARQWLDMLSPSNSPLANPQVLRETLASGGGNLLNGAANWWQDAMALLSGGKPRGVEAFRPGREVALTPGRVVFRNRLIELIQYEPTTPQVAREPVLVVPSWIMKFYILDLTPDDSFVRYLVDEGHTVFMMSWRNPDSGDQDLSLGDYVELGVFQALKAVQQACPGAGVHAVGYCLGGTLLAMAAAMIGAHQTHPLKTVTLLAAQVDFEEPGELGLFMDESQVAFLEDLMAEHGYLDGRRMAGAFQLINSKDLVWSKLVHEYLMGARTPMTAMRAWNADATRLPARMHSEYLRGLYMDNELAEGGLVLNGEPVRLGAIDVPMFVVATEADHVSPWRSVYRILRLVRTPVQFVLASGGHNVGIVSPPRGPLAHAGAYHRHGQETGSTAPLDPQEWADRAARTPGSWWPTLHRWLVAHGSDRRVRARRPGGRRDSAEAGLAAPGRYVFQD